MISLPRIAIFLVLLVFLFAVLTQRMFISNKSSSNAENYQNFLKSAFNRHKNISIQSLVNLIGHLPNLRSDNSNIQQRHEVTEPFSNISHQGIIQKPFMKESSTKHSLHRNNTDTILSPLDYPVTQNLDSIKENKNNLAILKCPNQSTCNVPELQLKRKFKIYFCKHPVPYGVRFYFIAKEAFLLHPNVILVSESNILDADFIIYLPGSAPWHKTECGNSSFARKLIVLDEFDPHHKFSPYSTMEEMSRHYPRYKQTGSWYFMYFKRSFVTRHNGTFMRYPHLDQTDVYPMVYSIAEAYIRPKFNFVRELEYVCTLRGSEHMHTRLRVQRWVAEYSAVNQLTNVISGEVNTASRLTVNKHYFEHMYNARIVVTVNPSNWEGDFRLWEAMCTGALIMVDPVLVPHPFPLIDGEHVIYFSNQNKTDLWKKLDYYRIHKEEARQIAINGYLHAMKYHRTVNFADYVLRSAHFKRAKKRGARVPKYLYTAQYLRDEAKRQMVIIKETQRPGLYLPILSS